MSTSQTWVGLSRTPRPAAEDDEEYLSHRSPSSVCHTRGGCPRATYSRVHPVPQGTGQTLAVLLWWGPVLHIMCVCMGGTVDPLMCPCCLLPHPLDMGQLLPAPPVLQKLLDTLHVQCRRCRMMVSGAPTQHLLHLESGCRLHLVQNPSSHSTHPDPTTHSTVPVPTRRSPSYRRQGKENELRQVSNIT